MSTDVLELALALHQAPIQRFALRDRPLPENIGTALQLASATQPQLADAAEMFSESEEVVLEAVRFYLHQVLFEPGTDAYRVLGLAPDADSKQIRQHFILLQRWLHPDRRGEDWEAVFATKVNWAWQQLRNKVSREEYDRSHQVGGSRGAAEMSDPGPMSVPGWSTEPLQRAPRSWLRSITIGALIAVCVGLFYLAVTREDFVESDIPMMQSGNPDSSDLPDTLSAEESGRGQNSLDSALPQQAHKAAMEAASARSASETATDATAEGASQSTAFGKQASGSRLAMERASDATTSPGSTLVSGHDSQDHVRTNATTRSGPTTEPSVRHTDDDSIAAIVQDPLDPAVRSRRRENVTETATHTPIGSASGEGDRSQRRSVVQSVNGEPKLAQADAPGNDSADNGAVSVTGDSATNAAAESQESPEPPNADTLQRFEMARERLRSMISFFRSPSTRAPEWDDGQGRLSAERVRTALHSRNSAAEIDRFALDPPTWRVSDASVALESTYHVEAKSKVSESGRFFLDMAWRDGSWKITRIEVSPSR
jgi:curved DNA-binding protein CbpA